MSYDIYIYNRTVKANVDRGVELDAFHHDDITEADMNRFLTRLNAYGYERITATADSTESLKTVSECPIQVTVFRSEIAFSVPYWTHSQQAIAEALQDACELSDAEGTVLFDPQAGDWSE